MGSGGRKVVLKVPTMVLQVEGEEKGKKTEEGEVTMDQDHVARRNSKEQGLIAGEQVRTALNLPSLGL